ncbi:hypothetical protein BGZ75_004142 [Mortierella antarctica]|nr:hypothetical protein BGZ67_007856 [Mortierella alpina]KAF9984288.1 hypothetical protein BGZ75_004142 [Mortierella antarctica]
MQSSLISNATSEIEAEFQDLVGSSESSRPYTAKSASPSASGSVRTGNNSVRESDDSIVPDDQDNQDWEWVEETEYIILDFGGTMHDSKDMEQLTSSGYSLVGLDTPTPYFSARGRTFKGFYDENAFTEDLLFDMKAYDNIKEGLDDGDDEIIDGLDLITIATKRIVFEQAELVHLERSREEPIANPQPASGKIFSIHKAARDTLGVKLAMNKKGKEVVREDSALENQTVDQDPVGLDSDDGDRDQ